jgi:hypothetical protein
VTYSGIEPSLLGNESLMCFRVYTRLSNNTRWLLGSKEWKTSTIGWAVFLMGPPGSDIGNTNKQTPWPLVRERTIPTERPPLVDEI